MRASQAMHVRGEWGMLGDFLGRLLSYREGGPAGRERRVMELFEISHQVMLREKKRKRQACLSAEGVSY